VSEGWKCPHCGKAHGPQVETCPEPIPLPTAWTVPYGKWVVVMNGRGGSGGSE